ncbi:MAG TPA: PDZ domain-containing protein, partial [Terriglobia bacterium]|nr:PDZ domain-containing protein [Terriglobia bacterium]
DARDAPRGILHSRLTIPVRSGPLTLLYPKWIPGEHGPSGPISDLVGLKLRANGRELSWRRDPLDLYSFHCEIPAGAQTLEVSLDFLSPAGTSGFSAGASTTPHLAVLSWNQLLLYPSGRSAASWTYEPRLRLPEGWQFGSALRVVQQNGAEVEFAPVSLETLVDSPLIAGRHFRQISLGEADGRQHSIAMVADEETALELKPDAEAGLRRLIQEAGALFGSRHYNRYTFLLTLSDHVAHFGLEHHESSDNRMAADVLTGNRAGASLGALLPHEYVHSWNGKYRRPEGLVTENFDQPMNTAMLWVYEGLTSYWGYVLAARSGLWSAEEFRGRIAQRAAALDHRVGRTWRPLEDTAVSAQFLYYARPGWNDWRRGTDFYDEAALIWLETDILLREKSNGRYSLDEFARRFYGGGSSGPAVIPYRFQDIVSTLAEMVPFDWEGFLTERLRSTAPRAPLGGIEGGGWRLVYREMPPGGSRSGSDDSQAADLEFSLGISVNREGVIRSVIPGQPADRAGIAPEMKVVAVNGRKYTAAGIRQAIQEARHSPQPIELLIENREYYQTYRLDYHAGERYPALERDTSRADLLSEILRPLTR